MARIRSIKPAFWTSEQVMECSVNARLLFIGLWNFCDDAGRLAYKPKQIKANIFPGDDISLAILHGMITELSRNGLIKFYTVGEQDYFYVTGWHHQKINRPQDPQYPAPDEGHSLNTPGLFTPDRIGKDRIGGEGSKGAFSESLVKGDAQAIHEEISEICQADPVKSPGWMSAAITQTWLNEGIDRDTITNTVREVMAKRDRPPGSPAYFTSAIREADADQSGGGGFGAPGTGWSQAKWCQ